MGEVMKRTTPVEWLYRPVDKFNEQVKNGQGMIELVRHPIKTIEAMPAAWAQTCKNTIYANRENRSKASVDVLETTVTLVVGANSAPRFFSNMAKSGGKVLQTLDDLSYAAARNNGPKLLFAGAESGGATSSATAVPSIKELFAAGAKDKLLPAGTGLILLNEAQAANAAPNGKSFLSNRPPENPNKIALGIKEHLDEFASQQGATTYKKVSKFRPEKPWADKEFPEYMSDCNNTAVFNLDGIDDVSRSIQRGLTKTGGYTDMELAQIYAHPEWLDRITWFEKGKVVDRPSVFRK